MMRNRSLCEKLITGNTWALWRALKGGSEWNPSDPPDPIHDVDILCTAEQQGCADSGGRSSLLHRTSAHPPGSVCELIHWLLEPRETLPRWGFHAMEKRGGCLLAELQQETFYGLYGLWWQAWHGGVNQWLQVTHETKSVFSWMGVSAASPPQPTLESCLK